MVLVVTSSSSLLVATSSESLVYQPFRIKTRGSPCIRLPGVSAGMPKKGKPQKPEMHEVACNPLATASLRAGIKEAVSWPNSMPENTRGVFAFVFAQLLHPVREHLKFLDDKIQFLEAQINNPIPAGQPGVSTGAPDLVDAGKSSSSATSTTCAAGLPGVSTGSPADDQGTWLFQVQEEDFSEHSYHTTSVDAAVKAAVGRIEACALGVLESLGTVTHSSFRNLPPEAKELPSMSVPMVKAFGAGAFGQGPLATASSPCGVTSVAGLPGAFQNNPVSSVIGAPGVLAGPPSLAPGVLVGPPPLAPLGGIPAVADPSGAPGVLAGPPSLAPGVLVDPSGIMTGSQGAALPPGMSWAPSGSFPPSGGFAQGPAPVEGSLAQGSEPDAPIDTPLAQRVQEAQGAAQRRVPDVSVEHSLVQRVQEAQGAAHRRMRSSSPCPNILVQLPDGRWQKKSWETIESMMQQDLVRHVQGVGWVSKV